MKKTVLALAVILTAFTTVTAQKKSEKFVTGTVSYTKSTDVKASYSLKPTVGYFLTDKVAVGVFGEVSESGDEKTTGVGVFGRCHFMTIGKHFDMFSQISVSTNSTTVADVKTTSTNANLGLGVNYFVTKRLGLTMDVANLISYENVDSKSTTTIGFEGVTNPFAVASFGVIYKF